MFDLTRPDPKDVHSEDIIKSLCTQQRFNGNFPCHYTVADHTLCMLAYGYKLRLSEEEMCAILLHDASETYTGDISRPVRSSILEFLENLQVHFDPIHEIENNIRHAIFKRYNCTLTPGIWKSVCDIDNFICAYELDVLSEGFSVSQTKIKSGFASCFYFTPPIDRGFSLMMFRALFEALEDGRLVFKTVGEFIDVKG